VAGGAIRTGTTPGKVLNRAAGWRYWREGEKFALVGFAAVIRAEDPPTEKETIQLT